MIRAAIVGMGWWGKTLVESVADSDRIRFVAGATRKRTADLEQFAGSQRLRLLDGFEAALADPDVDAIVLATPHSTHTRQVIAAAAAGKHVFCEKPFALTRADAEQAVSAMRQAGLTL